MRKNGMSGQVMSDLDTIDDRSSLFTECLKATLESTILEKT